MSYIYIYLLKKFKCYLYIADLKKERDRLMNQALAPSTKKAYTKQLFKFKSFCQDIGEELPQAFQNESVELWLAHLKEGGAACSTIRSHLSALRHHCLLHNTPANLNSPRIQLILKGIQREAVTGLPPKRPVTLSHLRRLINASQTVHGEGLEHNRFSAMISLAFYGFLRPSEICTSSAKHELKWTNVKFGTKKHSVRITLVTYKHSQQANSIKIKRTNTKSCPIKWLKRYKNTYKNKGTAVFPITVRDFQTTLEKMKQKAKIKTHITPHCLRHGGATWASNQGWTDAKIKAHGRWRSNAYTRYVKAN